MSRVGQPKLDRIGLLAPQAASAISELRLTLAEPQ